MAMFQSRYLAVFGILLLSHGAGALERLDTATLLDWCAGHEQALSSSATASCRAYVHGFIGGSFAVQSSRESESKPQSGFMRRAQETRVGGARLGYGRNEQAGYCIPAETNLSEIIARLNRYAAAADEKAEWANEFLVAALKSSFSCTR